MTKKHQIHEKWSKLGKVSHFECLARASEYFSVLANDWNLLRTPRGRKYLLTKKIARLDPARIKKVHICGHYPLDPYAMKI